MEPPRPLLASSGYATVYLIVPPGSFAEEFEHVRSVLKKPPRRKPDGIISDAPEVLYLLGQARFAARVEATDYRGVLKRAYPDRDSKALVSNAVFSIPYLPASPRKAEVVPPEEGMIRFLTHLRVRRAVYARDPFMAETAIITQLRALSDVFHDASIEAGLGWADFLVSGSVRASKFGDLLSRLVEFNRVRIDGVEESVFKRSLTLIGYEWTGTHHPPAVQEKLQTLMFIRARPGRLAQVEELLDKAFPHTDVALVDGKIDVVASVRNKKRPDFFAQHEKLSEETGKELIEKFETHVVFEYDLSDDARDSRKNKPDCGCAKRNRPAHYELEGLPETLTNAIRNIEFLFSSTMRDTANCCDARTAISACEDSLTHLMRKNVWAWREMADAEEVKEKQQHEDAALRAIHVMDENLKHIDRWVRTSERILRQRTVGSFEEFLGQSDRAVSYRGGAQKVLTVADNLMNDLYERIVGEQPGAVLTSLYDSVDHIEHVVHTGFVRMPVKALFFLPGVVPDLWHEVGGFHFFRIVPPRDVGLDLYNEKQSALYYDLADHFGDLISFLYGFKLDLDRFAINLVEGWVSSRNPDGPDAAQQLTFAQILARIVAIGEFLLLISNPRAATYLGTSDPREMAIKRRKVLIWTYGNVCRRVASYDSKRLPKPDTDRLEKVLDILERPHMVSGLPILRAKLNESHVAAAVTKLLGPVIHRSIDFTQPAELRRFNSQSDLNDEFLTLYWSVMEQRLRTRTRPNAFAFTAALTRGAALEYHRRVADRAKRGS